VRSEQSVVERFKTGVCRRSFSSPEALSYELAIAPALCQIVAPLLAAHAQKPPVLDVGCAWYRYEPLRNTCPFPIGASAPSCRRARSSTGPTHVQDSPNADASLNPGGPS